MSEPRVGIIITTKNRKDLLRHTITRSLEQDYANTLIAVFDDASSDGTPEMVRAEFPMVQLERNEASLGYIVNRNRAAKLLVDCTYLISLDDDSWMLRPDGVARVVALFAKNPDAALLSFEIFGSYHLPLAPDVNLEGEEIASFAGCGFAIHRERFLQLGGFPEFFEFYGEENDLIMRIMDAGLTCRFAPSIPVYHAETLVGRNEARIREYSLANTLSLFSLREPLWICVPHLAYVLLHRSWRWSKMGNANSAISGVIRWLSRAGLLWQNRKPIRFSTLKRYRRLQKWWGGYIQARRDSKAPRMIVALPPAMESK